MEDIFDDEFWAKRGWPLPPKPRRITAYDVLEVSPQASQETITAAYKSLSKRFHPDVCKGGEEKMKGITAAYQIVGDPKKRKEYDRQIKENRQ
jgi:curved DNA-binding protein CbpA